MQDKRRGVEAGVDLLGGGGLAVAVLLGVAGNKLVLVYEAAHRELGERSAQGCLAANCQEPAGVLAEYKFKREGCGCGFQIVGVDRNKDAVWVLGAARDPDVGRLDRGFNK